MFAGLSVNKMKRKLKKIIMRFPAYQYRHRKEPLYLERKIKKLVLFRGDKVSQLIEMMQQITITVEKNSRFAHWLDEEIWLFNFDNVIGNMPPDYKLILESSLTDLIKFCEKKDNKVSKQTFALLKGVEEYIDRIIALMETLIEDDESYHPLRYFRRMKTDRAESLEEALQRILFWSSLMWQSGHRLIGLGRLDYILDGYLDGISTEDIEDLLEDFFVELHKYYEFKSAALIGDIGQIAVLGGLEQDGSYFENKLTYSVIRVLKKIQLPDPKALLRVANNIPFELLDLAIECIATGIGSPLLSNDEIIIPALENFGYKKEDAYNYVTSACWEPVSYGNSLEQNNIGNINFAKVFADTMMDDDIVKCKTFEDFFSVYKKYLKKHADELCDAIFEIYWEEDPLFTFFTHGCIENNKDISKGGAVYSDYGLLSVGMGNAVDSLMNIKNLVFDNMHYSLKKLKMMWEEENDDFMRLQIKLKNQSYFYGRDDEDVVNLTNDILFYVSEIISKKKNRFGGRVKFGLSSPAYIVEGGRTAKTFDGRLTGEPMDVHISCKGSIPYTSLVSFAAKLNYKGTNANGNVVDFFASPFLISENKSDFRKFISTAIKLGFFQMQMNVVSSATLIEAQKDPQKFPSLIVRVWGFSAYFKDLPKEYQDVLIERLLRSEQIA